MPRGIGHRLSERLPHPRRGERVRAEPPKPAPAPSEGHPAAPGDGPARRERLEARARAIPEGVGERVWSAVGAAREEYESAVAEQYAEYERRKRSPGTAPGLAARAMASGRAPDGRLESADLALAGLDGGGATAGAMPGVAAARAEPAGAGERKMRLAMQMKDGYQEHDLGGQSAAIAYRFFFALFPFIIFLAALGGTIARAADVANPTDDVLEFLGATLPDDARRLVSDQLESLVGNSGGGVLSVGAVLALWAAGGGMNAVMKALNRVHGVQERRPLVPRYAVAIGLTLLASVGILGAFLLIVVGQVAGDRVAEGLGLSDAYERAAQVGRWPLAALLLILATAVLYRLAPNVRVPWRAVFAGAAFFVVVWLLATLGFGIYVGRFASYDATYGALAGVILLLLWFYLSSLALLLGAELAEAIRKPEAPPV